jgi:pre-mRNA cleavage complex 2 protein Pcf11
MDRSRPEGTSFLYGRLKLQCNQCGLRFFDSKLGKNKMDIHLDWHFTHKRRIREGAGRSQGRTWFTQEDVSLISSPFLLLSGQFQLTSDGCERIGLV